MYSRKVKGGICLGLVAAVLLTGVLCWVHFHAPTLHLSYDAPSYRSLEDLTANAEYIVTGTYTSFDGTWNMSRDPSDISREAADSYVEGRLYTFQVDSVIKGALSESRIQINLRHGEQVTFEEDDLFVTDPKYVEPELGQTYLLFLSKEHSQAFEGYYGTAYPFAIRLEPDGMAQLVFNQASDSGIVVSAGETSDGKRVQIETDIGAPVEDFVAGMSGEEVLQRIQDLLR